jgi:hypothetical protein
MDILRGNISGTSTGGVVKVLDQGSPVTDSLPTALALQAMHLISDVATPAGLPLSGWTALLSIDETLLGSGETVAEFSRGMHIHGYDTWHLPTMAMPVPLSCRCQAFAESVTIVLRVAEIPLVDVSDAPDMHAVTVGVDGTLVAGGGRPYTTRRGRGPPRTAVTPG